MARRWWLRPIVIGCIVFVGIILLVKGKEIAPFVYRAF
jgi:hypothetical protein